VKPAGLNVLAIPSSLGQLWRFVNTFAESVSIASGSGDTGSGSILQAHVSNDSAIAKRFMVSLLAQWFRNAPSALTHAASVLSIVPTRTEESDDSVVTLAVYLHIATSCRRVSRTCFGKRRRSTTTRHQFSSVNMITANVLFRLIRFQR
jgi:hypothetical protein